MPNGRGTGTGRNGPRQPRPPLRRGFARRRIAALVGPVRIGRGARGPRGLARPRAPAIGKVSVPRDLDRAHHALSRLLAQEARRREKFAASGWSWEKPRFDSPVELRRLRILNALFRALERRGHSASAYERDGVIDAAAIVGDTRVRLEVDLTGQHRDRPGKCMVPTSADLPAKTPLALTVDRGGGGQGTTWQDDAAGTVESRLADVAAGIVVAGEAAFRRGLKQAETGRGPAGAAGPGPQRGRRRRAVGRPGRPRGVEGSRVSQGHRSLTPEGADWKCFLRGLTGCP